MSKTLKDSLTQAMNAVTICLNRYGKNSVEYRVAAQTFKNLVTLAVK